MKSRSSVPGYNFLHSLVRAYKQVKNPVSTMEESMLRFGGTYSVGLGTQRFIVTQEPGLIDHVLRSGHRNYDKSTIQTDQLGRFLGNGLLTSKGEYWLRQRRLIQPGFHIERIHALYTIIEKTVDDFLKNFPVGSKVDVYPIINKLSFNIVINSLFNVNVPEPVQTELSKLIFEIQDYTIRDLRQFYKRWWHRLSGEDAQHVQKSRRVRDIIRDMIRQRQAGNEQFHDLLDMLLSSRYEDNGEPMTEEQLIDEITILIIAGHETTAVALSWTLYLLGTRPEIQEDLFKEGLSKSAAEAVSSDLFNSVIKESMRLYPPAWISDRVCLKPDKYNAIEIPAGRIMVLFYYGLHRDPKHWDNPEAFIPERFFKENFDKNKNKVYYPFGAGPRLCIGNNFAMAEMIIFLQRFVNKFFIQLPTERPNINALVTLKPEKMMLIITSKESGDEHI